MRENAAVALAVEEKKENSYTCMRETRRVNIGDRHAMYFRVCPLAAELQPPFFLFVFVRFFLFVSCSLSL